MSPTLVGMDCARRGGSWLGDAQDVCAARRDIRGSSLRLSILGLRFLRRTS